MKSKSVGYSVSYVLIFLIISIEMHKGKSIKTEVDLSVPPLLICDCAFASESNECKENFKDWLIVRDGFLQDFTHTERFDIQEDFTQNCYEDGDDNLYCALLKMKKVVLLGTGLKRQLHTLLDNKENVIFCPNSVHPYLTSLIIKSVKEIHISPEAITERDSSISLELRNIERNLTFPIGFYDYNYKLSEEGANKITNKKTYKEPVIISLSLFEVHDVKFESNCISTEGVKLSVTYATSLTIESAAVFDRFPGQSGISLKEIGKVDIHSTFSNYLIIDLCKSVILHTRSVSDSIQHLMLSNIDYFVTKEYSVTTNSMSLLFISNVKKWIPTRNSIAFHSQIENTTFYSQVTIENTTVYVNDQNSVLLTCNKLFIEMTQFVEFSATENSVEVSNEKSLTDWNRSGNYEYDNFGNETVSATQKGDLALSIENTPKVVFITTLFVTDIAIPNWVSICLLNDSITCSVESVVHQCPSGLPYYFGEEDYEQHGCYESGTMIDIWAVFHKFLLSFGGGLAVFMALLIIYGLIHWQSKKHDNWSPNQMNMPYLRSSPSRVENIPQLVHVPPRGSQIDFTFPKRFYGKTSPSKCETLMAVNLTYEGANHFRNMDDQKSEEKLTSSIELLKVKFLDESFEENDQSWTDRRCY